MARKQNFLFTDTDSLMYEIETDDFYKDISPDVRDKFDTSNYPKDHGIRLKETVHSVYRELKLGLIRKLLECLRMKLVD